MNRQAWAWFLAMTGSALVFWTTAGWSDEPSPTTKKTNAAADESKADAKKPSKSKDEKPSEKKDEQKKLPTVEEARERARLLHTAYEATLHAVHQKYFRDEGRTPIPARVMEDIFYWVDRETGGKTRWIAVNTQAMHLDHEPKTKIEKQAARALASGKEDFETVENGVYYRADEIVLVASCIKCHVSGLTQKIRFKPIAGLVISIPVETK